MNKNALAVLLILLFILLGGSYYIFHMDNPNHLTIVIFTFALVIIAPFSIYLLWIRPRALPRLLIYLSFILCVGIAHIMIPKPHRDFFNQMMVWLVPILEMSIIALVMYSITKTVIHYKRDKRSNHFLGIMRITLEPMLGNGFILSTVLTELSVFYYALFIWFHKPVIEGQGVFTYHKTSQIKTIVILFSILITIEGVFFHYLIQTWSTIFAWIFTILNIYALFYMVGLYNSVKFLPHIVTQDCLTIRLGYQSDITLNLRNIDRIKCAKENDFGDKIPKDTYLSLLKIDSPQYKIFLKEPALMKGSYGRTKYVKSVVFRADEPTKMMDSINAKLSSGFGNE